MKKSKGNSSSHGKDSVDLNGVAADWWAARFQNDAKREEFREALFDRLPDGDWHCYNDYDPSEGPLLDAVRACGIRCAGVWYSGARLFPDKTGINRSGGRLLVKEGRADAWHDFETGSYDCFPSLGNFADVTKRPAGVTKSKRVRGAI